MDRLKTLNDFQKLLGDINWVRPYLKLTTEDLGPLFDILKGSGDPVLPWEITTEARKALCKVEDAITKAHLDRVDITKPILLIIIATIGSPTGVFWQQGPTYWVHLHYSQKITLASYPELVGKLIEKAITNAIGIFGIVPKNIITPYKPETIIELAQESEVWATIICNYNPNFNNHYPGDPMIQMFIRHPFIFPKVTRKKSHTKCYNLLF